MQNNLLSIVLLSNEQDGGRQVPAQQQLYTISNTDVPK